ncbi:hypothetical protein PKB_1577 [Pseudomonas knackmussii B13]|uniref:Uncharacterized protein n=1 Tax=Pseudomonas knackmussii (strain DSM 6978 / CCUG 54928 / LMG 23759 / B13) TaxID=1301098 RepID=A0A024HEP5_PSEKB|nr:hypothetical protein PKB_1577 [Pseudomonas knackmussii B13]
MDVAKAPQYRDVPDPYVGASALVTFWRLRK